MNSTLEAPEQIYTAAAYQPLPSAGADDLPSRNDESPSAYVEIYDQTYHLRGVDPVYIAQLSTMVDQKMRAVSEQGNTVDSLRVAVLAALNIADELTSLRQSYAELAGAQLNSQNSLRSRADSLSGMLDEVLSDRMVG
jgi:cell division protein ZapA